MTGDNNRCLCMNGWSGEYCEVPEPGSTISDDGTSSTPTSPHADKFLQARFIEGGKFPEPEDDAEMCDISTSMLEIPFPQDIGMDRVVSVQVMCIDTIRNKVFFGVNSPSGGPVKYGSAELCKSGTVDLAGGTLVSPREMSVDFRYSMDGGKVIVERLGTNPDLDRCTMRVSITYFG